MAKTPQYTVRYFDARGRGEAIRLMLSYAGVPFTDQGVKREDWPRLKPEQPLGQLPVLVEHREDGDVQIPQSMAIVRHLARVHDLAGHSEEERLAADVAAETALDLRGAMAQLRHSPNWEDAAARDKYIREIAPQHLDRLERLLGARQWFAGTTFTYADLVAYDGIDVHLTLWPACLADRPRLTAHHQRIHALPTLQSYWSRQRPAV